MGDRDLMKPNFKEMTRAELRKYVLHNRDDQEAWDVYMDSRIPDEQATWYSTYDPDEIDEILQRKVKGEL